MQPLIPEGIIILVTEQDFQAQQIAQAGRTPKLSGSFEPVLQLAAQRFHGATANRGTVLGYALIVQMRPMGLKIFYWGLERAAAARLEATVGLQEPR